MRLPVRPYVVPSDLAQVFHVLPAAQQSVDGLVFIWDPRPTKHAPAGSVWAVFPHDWRAVAAELQAAPVAQEAQ